MSQSLSPSLSLTDAPTLLSSFLLPQLSYASSTGSLSDRTRFPNLWRTYPSEDNIAKAVIALVKQYNWKQLKIITEDESLFTSVRQLIYTPQSSMDLLILGKTTRRGLCPPAETYPDILSGPA